MCGACDGGGTQEAARRLARCARGDVLVAISLPRYSKDTVRLADFTRTRRAHVIALIDVAEAPLGRVADSLLVAPSTHPVMPSSAVGALAVIEAMAVAVMRLNPDSVRIARELAGRAGIPLHESARSQDAKPAPPALAILASILKQNLLSDHP